MDRGGDVATRLPTLLETLMILSKLKDNKKLKISQGLIKIDDRSVKIAWLLRWKANDKREKCHEAVKNVFKESLGLAEFFLREIVESSNCEDKRLVLDKAMRQYGRLTQLLEEAIMGYETQSTTYADDTTHVARVKVLVSETREGLTDMNMRLGSTMEKKKPLLPTPIQHQTVPPKQKEEADEDIDIFSM